MQSLVQWGLGKLVFNDVKSVSSFTLDSLTGFHGWVSRRAVNSLKLYAEF